MRLLILIACVSMPVFAKEPQTQLKSGDVVPWSSQSGIERLARSKYKIDFFKLANHFESQKNKIFCGPATAATVLNSLRTRKEHPDTPTDPSFLHKDDKKHLSATFDPLYKRYSQNNVFKTSPKTRAQVMGEPTKGKKDYGFQLRHFNELLKSHSLKTSLNIVSDSHKLETVRNEMKKNLATADDYVVINYKRTAVGQKGGGHISPVGAYDQKSDSFLILDVTPNKADWVWVKANVLVNAMRTFDTVENRGYILVAEGKGLTK